MKKTILTVVLCVLTLNTALAQFDYRNVCF